LQKSGRTFKSVLVTGPRQVGKTTTLVETFKGVPRTTFDDKIQLRNALSDPALFLRDNPPPAILDEVQYAPAIFPEIKRVLDDGREYGRYFLTGSQQYNLMENVTESLSGRIAVHELQGLSMREIKGVEFNRHFVPTEEYLSKRKMSLVRYDDIWQHIHRGSNPELQSPEIMVDILVKLCSDIYGARRKSDDQRKGQDGIHYIHDRRRRKDRAAIELLCRRRRGW